MVYRLGLTFCVGLAVSRALWAQSGDGAVTGTLRDQDGHIASYVFLQIDSLPDRARNDSVGNFRIDGLRPGIHVLRVNGLGYVASEFRGVRVDSGRTTSLGTLVVPTERPREVWLGCRDFVDNAATGSKCFTGRAVIAPTGVPRGAGVVRDSATWRKLWDRTVPSDSMETRLYRAQQIDWHLSMVILVSMGNDTYDCLGGDPLRINRVIETANSVEVVLGPDSLQRRAGPRTVLDAVASRANAAVVPRSLVPILFRYPAAVADQIGMVDWDRLGRN